MTRTAATLLAELVHRGVELVVTGDRLRYRPRRAVNAQLRADLIRYKQELAALVRHLTAPPVRTGTWGRCASALLARITDDGRRIALREAFEERVAICRYDGDLSSDEAERIAFVQLCNALVPQGNGSSVLPEVIT